MRLWNGLSRIAVMEPAMFGAAIGGRYFSSLLDARALVWSLKRATA